MNDQSGNPGKRLTRFLGSKGAAGYWLIALPLLLAFLLLVVPLGTLFVMSFRTQTDVLGESVFTTENYQRILDTPIYLSLLWKTIKVAATITGITILMAYPMAYFIAFHVHRNKALWLLLVTAPFWTSYLLRVFAWKILLGYNGALNSGLIGLGLIEEPLEFILYNSAAVVLTLTHAWAAIAILPIYVSLEKIDKTLLEAANDLGETPFRSFLRVTLPLSMPGVIAAALLIFIPIVGDYVTPALVGGSSGQLIANLVQAMFGKANNWPLGAAVSIVSMVGVSVLIGLFLFLAKKRGSTK